MTHKVKRNFYPGDEWVSFKIYGGIKICDELICGSLFALINKLKKSGVIHRWFFVRYSDPEFHIRFRINISTYLSFGDIVISVRNILKPYCDKRMIHKYIIDTYDRELERYNPKYMELTEHLFSIDSDCVCSVLQKIKTWHPDYRWQTAFFSVDSFLTALGYDTLKKLNIVTELSNSFRKEFGFNSKNSKQLNILYRSRRKLIEQAIKTPDSTFAKIKQFFDLRNAAIETCVTSNVHLLNVTSLLHMMMNRHFDSYNRLNEFLIYDYIKRFYKSELAFAITNYKQ